MLDFYRSVVYDLAGCTNPTFDWLFVLRSRCLYLQELAPLASGDGPSDMTASQLLDVIDITEGICASRRRALGGLQLTASERNSGIALQVSVSFISMRLTTSLDWCSSSHRRRARISFRSISIVSAHTSM